METEALAVGELMQAVELSNQEVAYGMWLDQTSTRAEARPCNADGVPA